MVMPISIRRYTVNEIASWPDDGNRYELLDGFLLVTPSPGSPHQVVATRIAGFLMTCLRDQPDVHVAAPGAIIVRPKTELQPDVLVFRAPGRLPKWEKVRDHLLAIEVQSRSTKVYDADHKRPAYLKLGVAEVWRVSPDERAIYVARKGIAERRHLKPFTWRPAGLDRAFLVPVGDFFRGID